VFLDHARIALLQIEAAREAARRAAAPAKATFALGFLTGYEMDWLPAVMALLRDELPSTEVVIHSQSSPELAAGLMRGAIDLAFLRHEKKAPGIVFRLLRKEPLIVLMPSGHRLAKSDAVRPQDNVGEVLIGVPMRNAPALREVTDRYGARVGVDLTPTHEADNLSMAISLVASTGGVALLPLYARNLLPPSVVSRPLAGAPPMIDLSLGYNEANTSPAKSRAWIRNTSPSLSRVSSHVIGSDGNSAMMSGRSCPTSQISAPSCVRCRPASARMRRTMVRPSAPPSWASLGSAANSGGKASTAALVT